MSKKLETGPFAGYTVEIAPQEKIDLYPDHVRTVLKAIGYPRAMVTDESSIADFGFRDPAELAELAAELHVSLQRWDRIWEVAERLYLQTPPNSAAVN